MKDPEIDEGVLERIDERYYGDPDDADVSELSGEAPLCTECTEKRAVKRVDGEDLCEDCISARGADTDSEESG